MAEYRLKGGAVLDDADFEQLAEKAERGIYPGTPGKWAVRPKGRPAIADEELVVVTSKVTRSQRDAMDRQARQRGETRSEWMRGTFAAALSA